MRKDREKAVALRQRGKSYTEITKKLGISKATLSSWFKDQPWSLTIRDLLSTPSRQKTAEKIKKMAAANRRRWQARRQTAQTQALTKFSSLRSNPLFLPAMLLYWGQGDLNPENPTVRFSTNDPAMLKIFFLFLTKTISFSENKIFCRLYLYPDLLESVQKNFWSKTAGVPLSVFKKSLVIAGKPRSQRKSFGVCVLHVYGRELKEKLLIWLEQIKKELLFS